MEKNKHSKKSSFSMLIVILIIGIVVFASWRYEKKHTFSLNYVCDQGISEQIQPVFGSIKVTSYSDTDVIFTDVDTGEVYTIGYITSGGTEKIRLKRGHWYTIESGADLTIRPINVRIE